MKVIWSPLATDRAVEEASFIALDKPGAADRWLTGLFKAVDRLEVFPNSGHPVPELPHTKYRQLVYKSHRVVFSLEQDGVHILAVRRFKQLLDIHEVTGAAG